jgi:glutamine synthetase
VLSRVEVESRYEILFENYSKIINIEALTAADMAGRQILPAALSYVKELATSIAAASSAGVESRAARNLLAKVSPLTDSVSSDIDALRDATDSAAAIDDVRTAAFAYREKVVPAMNKLRSDVDALEPLVPDTVWPMPVYADLLFRV